MNNSKDIYQCRNHEIAGTSLGEVTRNARFEFHQIEKLTPRRIPYVRSRNFDKNKVFIDNFWTHLSQKSAKDRYRRLKFFSCALELIANSSYKPDIADNPDNRNELLYRLYGRSKQGNCFVVQLKKRKHNGRLKLISVFPVK